MANSLLLEQGIGIGYERRLALVDQADSGYFSQVEHGAQPNPFSPESFFLLTADFSSRMLPELYLNESSPGGEQDVTGNIDLADRFHFLRAVAHTIDLTPDEIEPVAELLGVRPALLLAPHQIVESATLVGYTMDGTYEREMTVDVMAALIKRMLAREQELPFSPDEIAV